MEGFQLWLNLPGRNKMIKPSYRDIPTDQVPEVITALGVKLRVIAGSSHGVEGAVQRPDTLPIYVDVHLPAGAQFTQDIPAGHNAFAYTYRGEVTIAGTSVPDRTMAILANDGAQQVTLSATQPSRVLIIAGQPLNEPIAQYGPFVMNTGDEIQQTLRDYRDGKFEASVVQAL